MTPASQTTTSANVPVSQRKRRLDVKRFATNVLHAWTMVVTTSIALDTRWMLRITRWIG